MSDDHHAGESPPPFFQHVLRSVYGAWRVAVLDESALGWFDLTIAGFWRSFAAAIVAAPLYFLIILVPASDEVSATAGGTGVTANIVIYLVSWVGFPVVMLFVTRLMSLDRNYASFIIVHNWSQVVVMIALLPVSLAAMTGVVADATVSLAGLVVSIAVLFYMWCIARTALGAATGTAIAVVILDILIDWLIRGAAQQWL